MRTWVKLYTEILRDPKMAAMPDHRFRVCVNLIALAGQLDKDGLLGTTEEIAFHLRLDLADTLTELQELASVRVTTCKKGVWSLKNWDVRNGKVASDKPESRRERVQKWRENKANDAEVKRQGNADVTPLHHPRNGSREEEIREEEIREEKKELGADAPPPPASPKPKAAKAPNPPAVEAYRAAASAYPNKALWQSMAEAVGDKPADVAFWQQVVGAWIAKGYNPANVAGMFDFFKRRELPTNGNGNGNGHKPAAAKADTAQYYKDATGAERKVLTDEEIKLKQILYPNWKPEHANH